LTADDMDNIVAMMMITG